MVKWLLKKVFLLFGGLGLSATDMKGKNKQSVVGFGLCH